MNKISRYLKEYGLRGILKKIYVKGLFLFGLKKSVTIFFVKVLDSNIAYVDSDHYSIKILTQADIDKFDKMKYFHFIRSKEVVEDPYFMVITINHQERMVGYVILHFGEIHPIYGLGSWKLDEDEAWLGPAFVIKEFRGKGINSLLLNQAAIFSIERGSKKIFTCINQSNASSRRSFEKNDYRPIGTITRKKEREIFKDFVDVKYSNKFIFP